MRRDNERFVRIIDSGEWGRGRVQELVQVRSLPLLVVVFFFSLLFSVVFASRFSVLFSFPFSSDACSA